MQRSLVSQVTSRVCVFLWVDQNLKAMKLFVVVLLVASLAIFCYSEELSKEENLKKYEALAKTCQENEKASDADVKEALDHELPSTDAGKCLRACVMESVGVVCYTAWQSVILMALFINIWISLLQLQGLSIDLEAFNALTEKKTADETLKKDMTNIGAQCAPLAADTDRYVQSVSVVFMNILMHIHILFAFIQMRCCWKIRPMCSR